jgi:hypothetical protein
VEKVDAEYQAQYLGSKIWSVTKSCSDSSYDGEWYFYEDIGQLAPKWLSSENVTEAESGSQDIVILQPRKNKAFADMYTNMKKCLEQAYTLDQQAQDFTWSPIEDLNWTSKDKQGNEQTLTMKAELPSKDSLPALLTQCDICNGIATKLWLENPYQKLAGQAGNRLSIVEWYLLDQRLEQQIDKAEKQADSVRSDARQKLGDIDREFATSVTNKPYAIEFQAKRNNYSTLLDEIVTNLEQSKLLARKMGYQELNPFSPGG